MTKRDHIEIATADGVMPAFEAHPVTEARGGILVVQEAFGLTAHIEDVARRLATAGWYALAPALFYRHGSPVFAYDDLGSARPFMGQLSADTLTEDLGAAFEHIEKTGFSPNQTGIVGFCMGGTLSMYAATRRTQGAAVTFYGGGVSESRFGLEPLIELAPRLQVPWLGLYGDLDPTIPKAEVDQLSLAVGAAAVRAEIIQYPDADHGFNCNDRPAAFHPVAARDAWSRTLNWFDEHLA